MANKTQDELYGTTKKVCVDVRVVDDEALARVAVAITGSARFGKTYRKELYPEAFRRGVADMEDEYANG